MTRIGRTMHSANNRDSRRRGTALLLIASIMALCAVLSFAPDALADDGSYQDAAPAPADAVQADIPAGGAGIDSPSADGDASDVAAEAPAADADVEAGSIDAGIPADSGQAADGGDAGIADASGPADGADGDAAPRQPPAADGDGTASAEAPAGADGTLSSQDDAPSIPATMDRPTVGTRDASSAAVSWDAVDGASAYEVRWSPDGISWTGAIAESEGFAALGLDPDRRYLFQVRAIVGQGDSAVCGDWSASRAFTTPYLISYGLNGGVQAAGQRGWYRQNSATYILLAPTRNGYDFAGWYGNESLSGDAIDRILHGTAGNISLFAKWSQRDYTVTYILNGSAMFAAQNASRNPLTYVAGTDGIALASATRTGYHFAGWYLDEGLTQRIESIPAGSATDLVFYAKWLEREYAIRYVINSEADSPAANSADNPGTYRTGQEIVLADPRKNYCFFQGWFLDEDCTLRLGRIPIGCTGNIVLYAKWHEGEGDTIDIDPDHQDVVEYASGTVQVDDAVYTIGEGFVSIDTGASADPDALLSIINSLKAGQVLVLMPTQANPDGYCIAFDSLSIVDGIAIVSGSDPSYEQLLDSIELEGIADIGSATFTPADDVIVVSSPNMKASATGDLLPCLAAEIELEKIELELSKGGLPLKITLTPGFEFKITGKSSSLYAYITVFGKLEAVVSFSDELEYEEKLGRISIPLKVPGMSIDYLVYLVGNADGSATLKLSSKSTLGFKYENGKINPICQVKAGIDDAGNSDGLEIKVNAEIGLDVSCAVSMLRKPLVDVALGSGVKTSLSTNIRGTTADGYLICVGGEVRPYALLSYGNHSMLGETFKLKGTLPFSWLEEQMLVAVHLEKKPGGSFIFVDECTWKESSGNESEFGSGGSSGSGSSGGGGGSWGDDPSSGESWGDAIASGKCGDDVYWALYEDGLLRIWGSGAMWDYSAEVSGSDNNAPWKGSDIRIENLIIEDGITSISGFSGCSWLETVSISHSVTKIGAYAFSGCSDLSSVEIPDSVISIESGAFECCDSLEIISIPKSVTMIGDGVFQWCYALDDVVIPDSVVKIGKYAFNGCDSLSSISLSNSLTTIEEGAFEYCTSLETISIPESVSRIGKLAFAGCDYLSLVTIPDSVESIGEYAFSGCTSLEDITIPDSVESIGEYAFSGCTSLEDITIPDSVESIGEYAFDDCSSLITVILSNSLNTIERGVFSYCTSLASIVIPDSVNSIEDGSFACCESLESIVIPDSVIKIGAGAFEGCESLLSVDFSKSVMQIGASAFHGCVSLDTVSIPNKVTLIDNHVFSECSSLVYVFIPNSVVKIGCNAFGDCISLTSVLIPDSVSTIDDYAFSYCSSLTSISIPSSVSLIGERAFYKCSSLASASIPDSVLRIESEAFSGCSSLAYVSVPSFDVLRGNVFDSSTVVVARDGSSQEDAYIDSEMEEFCISDESCFEVLSDSVECSSNAYAHERPFTNESMAPHSNELQVSEGLGLSVANECNDTQDQQFSVSCVAGGDSVVLVVSSDGTEPQLIVGDSSLSQGADIIVLVTRKDDDDQTDDFCSTDSYHPDSVLIA